MLKQTTRKINELIVHCADTYARMDIGVDDIRKWHVEERKWKDIGYHFVIKRDGTIQTGRDIKLAGAHVAGRNANSIGICLVGGKGDNNKPENNFTDRQFSSLGSLLRGLKAEYPNATIHGHNEFDKGKTCPNFDVQEWVKGQNL